jgi:hypothetical protein
VLAKVLPYAFGAAIGGGYSFVTTWSVIGAIRWFLDPRRLRSMMAYSRTGLL